METRSDFKKSLYSLFYEGAYKSDDILMALLFEDKLKLEALRLELGPRMEKIDYYLRLYDEAPTPEAKEKVICEVSK